RLGSRVSCEAPRQVLGGRGPSDRIGAVGLRLARRLGKEESLSRSARFRIALGTILLCGTGSPRRINDCWMGGWLDPRDRGRGRRGGGGGLGGLAGRPV